MLKDKQISEDAEHDGLDEVPKLTGTYFGKIGDLTNSKEQEIMIVSNRHLWVKLPRLRVAD